MTTKKPRVLIVDDEKVVCDLLHDELSERGYLCTTVLSGKDALTKLAKQSFDAVLLDIRLPGMSGMAVLREIWLNHSDAAVIMITAVNDVATAVLAMKWGASDYITKPFNMERIDASIGTALAKRTASKSSARMNAIAGRGGKLNIKTRQMKDCIRITFTDDGPGISAEHLGNVFNPFFTTRGGRGGTGLGLSVCHSIITEHNGRIHAKSQPGMGATFSVELPLTAKRMGKGQAAQTFLP